MAYSSELWEKAKGYYEAGLTLSKIQIKTGIDKSVICKKAKRQQWQHGSNIDYIKARETIAIKNATKSQQVLHCADEVADEKIRHLRLINDNAEKLADKINHMTDIVNNANELKSLVDANDRLAITLKVADRHANNQVTVNNTNAQQNNKSLSLEDFYKSNY